MPYIPESKSAPGSQLRRPTSGGIVLDHVVTANIMPTVDIEGIATAKIDPTTRILPEIGRHSMTNIHAPRGAPSSISSESFLKSRASFSPEFIHNELNTRIARTSNLYAEAPRFRNDVDLLA